MAARSIAQPAVDPRAFMPKQAHFESRLHLDFENDDMVIESLPGYSRKASRCCPDSPKIEVKFKFTGNAIALDGIR